MDKREVMKIERKARNLMNGQSPPKGKRISIIYYYILEDRNFHNKNRILSQNRNFGDVDIKKYPDGTILYSPKAYGSKYAEALYKDYKKSGGRG